MVANRRRNEAKLPLALFRRALRHVIEEVRTFSHALLIDDHLLLSSAQYAIKHNSNAADAIHLAIVLTLQMTTVASDDELRCLTADKRLIRAARAEGIAIVDPEDTQTHNDG